MLSAAGTESDDFIEVQGLLARTRLLYGFTGSADTGGIEHISMNPFGGTDNVTIRDLGGTATTKVDVRLNTADLRVDTLTVIGTQGLDKIKATSSGTTHTVSGLPATVNLIDPERGTKFAIDARDGDDTVEATGITRDTLQPTLKGGAGRDTIIGSSGDDTIAGGTGVDVALMGGGLDTFGWGPGEGNDIVEGGAGTDFLQMNGSGGNDRFDVVPVGSRTRVTRDIENVNLDLGGVERLDILPGPGGDILRVADLSGTAPIASTSTSRSRAARSAATTRSTASSSTAPSATTRSTSTAPAPTCERPGWPRSPRCAEPIPSSTGCTSTPSPASTR